MIKCVHSVIMRSVFPVAHSVTVAFVQLEHVLSKAWVPVVDLMLSRGVPLAVFKLTMSTEMLARFCPEVNFRVQVQ